MTLFLDIVSTAAILFIVAAGLLAIFGVLKIINFAHGAWLTIGAYCAVVVSGFGLNPWLAIPFAFLVGAILGGVLEYASMALGMTMKGSLPPSSRTVFLICFPATLATLDPARSLPVRLSAIRPTR